MSIGLGLLKAIYDAGPDAFSSVYDSGISSSILSGDEKTVFEFLENFYLSYGTLPTRETLEVRTGIAINLDNFPSEPIEYWADRIKERNLLLSTRDYINRAQNAIGNRDISLLRDNIQAAYIRLEEGNDDHSIKSITDTFREVIEQHDAIQNSTSLPGIPFAFPFFNYASGGMWSGDLVAYIGRPAMCKSYLVMNDAENANASGAKVLFISMEMALVQCGRRILALRTGVNYSRLRLGRVSSFGISRLMDEINNAPARPPFQLVSGGIFGSIDRIYAQIKHYRPDIVYIDGAYLIRTKGKSAQRWERLLGVLEVLKQIALSENIPIVITYQFNKTTPGTLEGVAFTDGVAQLASIVFSIESENNEEIYTGRPIQYRTLKLLKGREGETGQIRVELDFDQMSFRQDSIISGIGDEFEYEREEANVVPDEAPVEFI